MFVVDFVNCYGVVVDFVIYVLYIEGDIWNFYVYVMMMIWKVEEVGFGEKIMFEYKNVWFLLNGLLIMDMQICDLRQFWESIVNSVLQCEGLDICIDYCLYQE